MKEAKDEDLHELEDLQTWCSNEYSEYCIQLVNMYNATRSTGEDGPFANALLKEIKTNAKYIRDNTEIVDVIIPQTSARIVKEKQWR